MPARPRSSVKSRTLAVGDVHGCRVALETVLAAAAPVAGDVVVTLGDYIDRGPDTRGVLDYLTTWRRRHPGVRLVALRGNHEIMLLNGRVSREAAEMWLGVGGERALASYATAASPGSPADIPPAHWQFLERRLLPYHETDTHLFVHAGVYAELTLSDQPDDVLYWEHLRHAPPRHRSGKTTVCGHTPQRSGLPRVYEHAVCLDTAACDGQWLTCLCCETGELWQASEAGETRSLWLDEV